jgi:hypothetical protein
MHQHALQHPPTGDSSNRSSRSRAILRVCAAKHHIDAPQVTVVVTSSVEANQQSTPGVWYLSMLYWAEMWQQEQQETSTHDAQSSQQSQSEELKSCGLKDDGMRQRVGADM